MSMGEGHHWISQFILPFQDWELEFVDTFFEVLYDNFSASTGND